MILIYGKPAIYVPNVCEALDVFKRTGKLLLAAKSVSVEV